MSAIYCPTCRGPSGTGGECGRCLKGPWWELEYEEERVPPECEPQKFTIPAVVFRDHDADVDAFVGKITPASHGYFNHRTGAAEPPSGPEVDIVRVLDAKTGAPVELCEADLDLLVIAVAEQAQELESAAAEKDYELEDRGFGENYLP